MSLNFPNNPSTDDLFPDPPLVGVPVWQFDGVKWIARSLGSLGVQLIVSDTRPANPATDTLWWDTTAGRLFVWTSLQWVEVVGAGVAGPQGEVGPIPTINIGTVNTTVAGGNAEVTVTGAPANRYLNFVLPRGVQGPMGDIASEPIDGDTWGRKDGDWERAEPAFAIGSGFIMSGPIAPVGYVISMEHDDKALRIVSGIPSSGGSVPFSTVFGRIATDDHTLTIAQLAAHTHGAYISGTAGFQAMSMSANTPSTSNVTTSSTGSGTAHRHNIDLRVEYLDVILAVKQ